MSKIIAVYGSLKKGKYNHSLLETAKFLGDTTIKGTLYSLGSYPAIIEEGDNVYPAEVYEVDERTYGYIRGMELGAGYKEVVKHCNVKNNIYYDCIVYYADSRLEEYCKESKAEIKSY